MKPIATEVLIVEDQPPLRAALRDFIASIFPAIRVFEAEDGASAIALFSRHRPPMVLMDVCLPDANGIDLTRRIKAMAPEVVVVVMSVQDDALNAERALGAGAIAFVGKDRLFAELVPLLGRLSEQRPDAR